MKIKIPDRRLERWRICIKGGSLVLGWKNRSFPVYRTFSMSIFLAIKPSKITVVDGKAVFEGGKFILDRQTRDNFLRACLEYGKVKFALDNPSLNQRIASAHLLTDWAEEQFNPYSSATELAKIIMYPHYGFCYYLTVNLIDYVILQIEEMITDYFKNNPLYL